MIVAVDSAQLNIRCFKLTVVATLNLIMSELLLLEKVVEGKKYKKIVEKNLAVGSVFYTKLALKYKTYLYTTYLDTRQPASQHQGAAGRSSYSSVLMQTRPPLSPF